jgi:tRNA (cytidine/uridine-2'-O-)-methyltransferase
MLHVILYQPEIPPNTGNIIRLCANSGARLHLVGPLGFVLDDARLRRAGLDYDELTDVRQYLNWPAFLEENPGRRLWAFSTRGKKSYYQTETREGDGLLFGPESRGLPDEILDGVGADYTVRIPMQKQSRSLNLSNTVAIGVYEALRQLDFRGLQ